MHLPVLTREVIEYLNVQPNRNYIDATINGGGHARAILERNGPEGKVLGIDWDEKIIEKITGITGRLELAQGNFADLQQIVAKHRFGPVHGILFDLGLSSWHLEESGRGFSFQKDEPLLMTYDPVSTTTAALIVNTWSKEALEELLREYGEERFARAIAERIVAARKDGAITGTLQLAALVEEATPGWYRRLKRHPATKTFQALRIAVNDELENLERALPGAFAALTRAGRLAIITFHSLEDRRVKNFFRRLKEQNQASIITKRPVAPLPAEIRANPRARSAKLRVIAKT